MSDVWVRDIVNILRGYTKLAVFDSALSDSDHPYILYKLRYDYYSDRFKDWVRPIESIDDDYGTYTVKKLVVEDNRIVYIYV